MSSTVAVGFDFDHTLGIDSMLERTVALASLAELARRVHATYDVAAAEAAIDGALHTMRSGDVSVESAIATFFERFVPAGGELAARAAAYRDDVLEAAPSHVKPLPGALDLLRRLDEAKIPYALLTNGWSPLQEEKARIIEFRGPVFVSERIGARKPESAAFAMLVKHFEVPPSDIWYLGDDPVADCGGAAAAGMRAVWFDWEDRTYPGDVAPPAATIRRLDDFFALLPCA